jgi:hypothetical protein
MATQPTTPPSVTAWPDAPSRAEPSTFSDKADAFLGHFPIGQADQNTLVTWLNSTAGQAYQNALEAAASATAADLSADDAAQSVIDANQVLSSAYAQANYKGAWSSLTGALNIPASVSHDNGVWLLTTNLANVAASEPAIGNANWLLIYSRATDLQVETGVAYTNPDSKQLKDFVQRDWGELTTAKGYNDSCFYRGKEYDINIPVDDVTIAPPTTAGRTFTNFNGTSQYITIPTINLIAGDVVKFKFLAPTSVFSGGNQVLIDSESVTNRLVVYLDSLGRLLYQGVGLVKLDSTAIPSGTNYPADGLVHSVELNIITAKNLFRLASNFENTSNYNGRIYDLEVIRGGERIHYYPLRVDAVDYKAGNLVSDEEFTNTDKWTKGAGWSIGNNKATAIAGAQSILSIPLTESIVVGDSVRVLYDATISAGSVTVLNSGLTANTSSGTYDAVAVYTGGDTLLQLQKSSDFVGDISNVRVIKLNELSPSASFSSATGFTLSGGVTITGGQAVFGSGAGLKFVRFNANIVTGEKYRINYKVSNRTVGRIRAQFDGDTSGLPQAWQTSDGAYDVTLTSLVTGLNNFRLLTDDGWDGNVEYFSVTKVTDGTEVGTPLKTFERHWKLKSGEQLLPQNAGIVRFGVPATIDASNTLEIEPLANASKGDYIKVARTNNAEPIIKLSAADIAAGRLIKFGVLSDTELTIDSDKAVILEHNGQDLEVKL